MFRLHLLVFAVLSSCIAPLAGMNPQDTPAERDNKYFLFNETNAELFSGGLIVPVGESAVLSTVFGFAQALMYLPVKEALCDALATGTIAGWIGLACMLPTTCLGIAFGADIDHRRYLDLNPRPFPSFFQWKQSKTILFTALFTGFSLYLEHELLADGRYSH